MIITIFSDGCQTYYQAKKIQLNDDFDAKKVDSTKMNEIRKLHQSYKGKCPIYIHKLFMANKAT